MKVRHLMTTEVSTCSPSYRLDQAAQTMWDNDCGCLPVTDSDGRLVGMLTDRDICMAAYTRGQSLDRLIVADTMSRDVVSCSPDDSLRVSEELMQEWQIRRLPVLENGKLAGIVTLGDIARRTANGSIRSFLIAPGLLKTLATIYAPPQAG